MFGFNTLSLRRTYWTKQDSKRTKTYKSAICRFFIAYKSCFQDNKRDHNLRQDSIKRKTGRAARNLDTIQRIVLAILAIWKNKRKKVSDKIKGTAEIIRELSQNLTKVLHFLAQK
mgnify:FL=1